jgi:hypothetical protein
MKRRAIKWLVPVAVVVFAMLGGDGPWPPM